LQYIERQLVRRKAGDGEAEDRRRAHRVNIGDGIRRRDLAEEIGIVDDRREEIDGLRDGRVADDAQHCSIVGGIRSDQKIPDPFGGGETGKDRAQVILTQLAGSTTCRRERRQRRVATELVLHGRDGIAWEELKIEN
jgi:hypothetical protein